MKMTQIKDIIKGYDLNYFVGENSPQIGFSITKNIFPQKIFKYFPIQSYNIEVISNYKFYGLSYLDFNDIFELGFREFNSNDVNYSDILRKERLNFSSKYAVVCFSKEVNNQLLWGYYTSFEGFAIEFDVPKLIYRPMDNNKKFISLNPICYADRITEDDYGKIFSIRPEILSYLILSNIKRKEWAHEEEWRLICYDRNRKMEIPGMSNEERDKTDDRFFRYNPDSIHAIYLGPKFFGLFEKKEQNENSIIYSCNIEDKSRYLPSTNEKINIKKKILKLIQERKLPCYIMDFDPSNFELFPKRVDIKGDDGKYEIKNI